MPLQPEPEDLTVGAPSKLPNVKAMRLPAALVNAASCEPFAPPDALAVHEAICRVYLAEDSRDYDALRAIFTEDGVHDHSIDGRVQGAEAVVGFVQDNLARGFDGVRHHALNVITATLAADVGRQNDKLLVKYDPRDLSRVFARRPSGTFVEARYSDLTLPSITLSEAKAASRALHAKGRREVDARTLERTRLCCTVPSGGLWS